MCATREPRPIAFTEQRVPRYLATTCSPSEDPIRHTLSYISSFSPSFKVTMAFFRQRTVQAGKAPDWKKAIVTLKEGDKIVLT